MVFVTLTGLGGIQAALILLYPLVLEFRTHFAFRPSIRETAALFLAAFVRSWRNPLYYVGPLLATIALSGLFFAQGVKRFIAERDRPSGLPYAEPLEQIFHNSFPSGHTTTSFALAWMVVLLTRRTENAWMGGWTMVWATLVGISRIYLGVHWPTDVLAGFFFGMASASVIWLVLRRLGKLAKAGEAAAGLAEGEG
jgi:membrane-associated phospholipid phosphatase